MFNLKVCVHIVPGAVSVDFSSSFFIFSWRRCTLISIGMSAPDLAGSVMPSPAKPTFGGSRVCSTSRDMRTVFTGGGLSSEQHAPALV